MILRRGAAEMVFVRRDTAWPRRWTC